MTKPSPILICAMVDLQELPPSEVDVIRRFLFDHIRGMDAKHDKRWRRLWGQIWRAEPGEGKELFNGVERSLRFHRRWMAIERRVFENQDRYVNLDRFRDWLKTGAGFGTYQLVKGVMRFVPSSLSYERTSDDEMREFVDAAVDFLNTQQAQKKLWRHLPAAKRQEMVDTLLADPKEHTQ